MIDEIMNSDDLVALYEKRKAKYGKDTYRHVSEVLEEAKIIHKKDFSTSTTAIIAKKNGKVPDHEQSWRAFKGKNLEKLIIHIIVDEVRALKLEVIGGASLERSGEGKLPAAIEKVKRNLVIDYGEFGMHLPDVDLVIYNPKDCKVIAVLSSKVTLRERVAQTGYWKFKLMESDITKHIKVFFITPDEDGTLTKKIPTKKGRAIVETDLDGTYVMTEANIEESDKVKLLDKFIDDLRKISTSNSKS
jgi:type II restriction enzyme